MVKDHTDKELIELKQLQKEHLMELLKNFKEDVTEDDLNTVFGIVSKVNLYLDLHMESVRRKLEKSLTPSLKKKLEETTNEMG
jgi:hypothetical protein